MKSEHPPYLPNPTQHLLMKAALMKEKKATQAWQAWKSTVDLDDIDSLAYSLKHVAQDWHPPSDAKRESFVAFNTPENFQSTWLKSL